MEILKRSSTAVKALAILTATLAGGCLEGFSFGLYDPNAEPQQFISSGSTLEANKEYALFGSALSLSGGEIAVLHNGEDITYKDTNDNSGDFDAMISLSPGQHRFNGIHFESETLTTLEYKVK